MIEIDSEWTLFLDRDGVINHKIENGYVTSVDGFRFIKDAKNAIASFSKLFARILIVTNQQCVGKGILSRETLDEIHDYMQLKITEAGGKIDRIYYAPQLAIEESIFRKPNSGMAFQAKNDFPEINFEKSILIGDSISDLKFGKNVGMTTIFISDTSHELADYTANSLINVLSLIKNA